MRKAGSQLDISKMLRVRAFIEVYGYPYKKISEMEGISERTITRWKSDYGWRFDPQIVIAADSPLTVRHFVEFVANKYPAQTDIIKEAYNKYLYQLDIKKRH